MRTIQEILASALVYAPMDSREAVRIDFVDYEANQAYCTGEETGEQYCINFDEFDLVDSIFYELKPMSID